MQILIDLQGELKDKEFETEDEVREYLANYHNADIEDTESKTLAELIDLGNWGLLDSSDLPF